MKVKLKIYDEDGKEMKSSRKDRKKKKEIELELKKSLEDYMRKESS